ncbi:MAG: hypothetical protein AAGI54_12925 [Planctomycetota bacterium]
MLPKLLVAILALAAAALVVLDARQRQIAAAHDVARLYQRLHATRHEAAGLRHRIEQAAAPAAIAAAVREANLPLADPTPAEPPVVAHARPLEPIDAPRP